jgi:outer membrane protein assembly factor BamB
MASSPTRASVLVDQVGYDTLAPKQAIVAMGPGTSPRRFVVVNADTGAQVWQGDLSPAAEVAHWGDGVYAVADFSGMKTQGHYYLALPDADRQTQSAVFAVQDNVLERNTLSNIIYYFKGQRSSGLLDQADRHLPHPDGVPGYLDLHGGWYDATGDYGIHLSHQNPTSYFNTQQLPLAAWSLFRT